MLRTLGRNAAVLLIAVLCIGVWSAEVFALPPVAVADAVSTPKDTPVTFNLISNDFDPDGDPIRILSHTQAINGSLSCGTRECTYTPDPGFIGDDGFFYTIQSVDGTSTAQVGIEVLAVNTAPIARNDSGETNEDTPITIHVIANDSDPDGDSIRVIRAGVPNNGTASCTETHCTYTPDEDFNGVDTFSYNIADHRSGGDSALVTITVIAVNEPPKPRDDEVNILEDESVTIDIFANDVDPDGEEMTLVEFSEASNGTVDCVTPEDEDPFCTYTPDARFSGVDTFTYTLEDESELRASATVTINVERINDLPTAEANGPYECQQGDVIILSSSGSNDPDGTIDSFDWGNGLTGPSPSYSCDTIGTFQITLIVTDNDGATASDTAQIEVSEIPNVAPIAEANGPYQCQQGDVITLSSAGSSDSDGQIVSYDWSHGESGASPSYSCDVLGTQSVTLTVTDDDGATSSDTAQIEISEIPNVAPTAEANGPYSCQQGDVITLSSSGSSDSDGQIVSYDWSHGESGASPSYSCDLLGTQSVTLTVTDDDGATASDSAQVNISEVPNVPPTANANGPYECQEGEVITLSSAGSNDPDGEIVSYDWSFGGTGPSPSYTCDTLGTTVIMLTVTDDDGASSSNTSTTVTVSEVPNEPPVADAGGPYSCEVGGTVTLSGAGSFDLDGEIVSYQWSNGMSGESITVSCDNPGALNLTLTVTDDRGATASKTATINVEDNNGWDKSSLSFVGNSGSNGDRVFATIMNSGDRNMLGTSEWELWYAPQGNPKNGQIVATGIVPQMNSGSTAVLEAFVTEAGNYKFKAYQRPGHPGKGELWSGTMSVDEDDLAQINGPSRSLNLLRGVVSEPAALSSRQLIRV